MFSTSLDILYLVLSACVLFLTIFLCVALYEFIVSMTKINRLAGAIEKIVVKSGELISFVEEKVHHSSALFLGAAEIIKNIFSTFAGKKEKKKEAKKKGKK